MCWIEHTRRTQLKFCPDQRLFAEKPFVRKCHVLQLDSTPPILREFGNTNLPQGR